MSLAFLAPPNLDLFNKSASIKCFKCILKPLSNWNKAFFFIFKVLFSLFVGFLLDKIKKCLVFEAAAAFTEAIDNARNYKNSDNDGCNRSANYGPAS